MLYSDDSNHKAAQDKWRALESSRERLATTNYVIVEACTLLQKRLGLAPVHALLANLLPLVEQHFIDEPLHQAALDLVIAMNRRKVSVVDATSFLFMRRGRIQKAFAFDAHFQEFGFET